MSDDFENPFGKRHATHIQCAGCGEVKASVFFRTKSTQAQALARGLKRPYEVTSKYCDTCRAQKAQEKRNKTCRLRGADTSAATRRKLTQRLSWATHGVTNECAYVLEARLKESDGFIRGKRKEAQYKRWRDVRAKMYAPDLAEMENERSRFGASLQKRIARESTLTPFERALRSDLAQQMRRTRTVQEAPLSPEAIQMLVSYRHLLEKTSAFIRDAYIENAHGAGASRAENKRRWQDIMRDDPEDAIILLDIYTWYMREGYTMLRKALRAFDGNSTGPAQAGPNHELT